jgi:hypothetical protein
MARMRTHSRTIVTLVLLGAFLSPFAHAADKLKGFYSGSGGISAEVHRVLLVEFAADGTVILQQKWHDKDPPDLACQLEAGEKQGHDYL